MNLAARISENLVYSNQSIHKHINLDVCFSTKTCGKQPVSLCGNRSDTEGRYTHYNLRRILTKKKLFNLQTNQQSNSPWVTGQLAERTNALQIHLEKWR